LTVLRTAERLMARMSFRFPRGGLATDLLLSVNEVTT
jgi:hypothetical protein